ncbi:hypothetical protein KKC88_02400 [Patescibacteria group bacterium]|nr:hypothetical protein [Patescibacteria group bacterium]MBU1672949.1 hypothetical protein [Patescibacteria group bacterium]
MPEKKKNNQRKTAGDDFAKMFIELGDAISEVFNDPKLKKEAKNFGKSAKDSAVIFSERFKDDKVKKRFKKAGKAAEKFGKRMKKEADKL